MGLFDNAKFPKVETRIAKPIIKECPHCNIKNHWYWTGNEDLTKRGLKGVECNCELDPFDLDIEPYSIWKKNESNFYPVKESVKSENNDFMDIIPESRKISRSSTES